MPSAEDLGPFASIVSAAGSLVAASIALLATWRRRARWEPSEEDVPAGPQRVGGLVAAVLIGLLWVTSREPNADLGVLRIVALGLLVATVVFFLVYGFLIQTQTFDDVSRDRKVIGGFRLTENAAAVIRAKRLTIQRFFAGTAFDPDEVWTRPSRALAKTSFVVGYLGFTVCGTVALATVAILVDSAL